MTTTTEEARGRFERIAYPPELKALHKALAQAQGEFPPIPKTQTADAGSYSYDYADLASIIAIVRPILSKHGLALIQRLEQPNGQPSIRTELLHQDGATIASSFPIGDIPQNVQQLGSKITYLRRYTVVAMLGLAAGEDDDGHKTSAPGPGVADTTSPQPGAEESERGPGPVAASGAEASLFQPPDLEQGKHAEEDLSSAQRKKIFAIKSKLTQAGLFDDETFKGQLLLSFGVDSISGLTKDQASDLITRLLAAEEKLDAA